MQQLEVDSARQMSDIEINKFKSTVDAIGKNTIVEMSRAGPELQAKLLKGLGLKGFMISDGKMPINLMQTAEGMLGGNK
jgi:major vault protein